MCRSVPSRPACGGAGASPIRIARRSARWPPRPRSSRAAWTMQSGLPARTSAPTATTSVRPTEGSIASSACAAPAAQRHDGKTDLAGVHADDVTGPLGGARPDDRRVREIATGVLEEIARPAQRRHHAGEDLAPRGHRPRAASARARPAAALGASPPSASISPASAIVDLVQARVATRLRPSDRRPPRRPRGALPTLRPSTRSMSVISATVGSPALVATATRLCGQLACHRLGVAEGAGAELHVHHQPVEPRGELLRQDRADDQRDRFDGGRHVAHRIEPPVGRREIGGLADDGAADLAHDLAEGVDVGLRLVAGDGATACRACRRCGRGRGRRSSARSRRRRRRSAPASGSPCRRRRRSNACRAPGPAATRLVPVERGAGCARGPGSVATRSAVVMPRKNTAMAKAATWPSLRLPSRDAAHDEGDLLFRQLMAVALPADDLLRQHALVVARQELPR